MDYRNVCFVIMPFGSKTVKIGDGDDSVEKKVDFDAVYDDIFVPAIAAAGLPEGGQLIPRRTDKDFFSGVITNEMYEYIQHSRFAVADVSGLNANVFYELGVRHAVVASGTAIFRQPKAPLPFDIRQIKAFDYAYEPADEAERSRALITKVLTDSLQHNHLDSPVRLTLARQHDYSSLVKNLMCEAENEIRNGNWRQAAAKFRTALDHHGDDMVLWFKLGLMQKKSGSWQAALDSFEHAVTLDSGYGEAHRERGVVQNKLFSGDASDTGPGADPTTTGEAALEKAIELSPSDFDAMASLGGVLKRAGRLDEALAMYRRAADVSDGNSYPLLNALRLEAVQSGKLALEGRNLFLVRRAERQLRGQVAAQPPTNAPWSFFDLAEICLYQGDRSGFLEQVDNGSLSAANRWEAATFRDSLTQLKQAGIALDGLDEGIARLDEAVKYLPE